jgi:RHS repeat-associated protein
MPAPLIVLLHLFSAVFGGTVIAFSSAIAQNRTGIATGTADPAATVTINGGAAPRQGQWWGQSNSTSSGSLAAWLDFSIDATLGGNTEHTDVQLLVPPSSISPTYDADGNLTDDGLRTFTWDAEPRRLADAETDQALPGPQGERAGRRRVSHYRLTSVTTKDTLLPASAPMYRVTYQYDDGGRRIAQTVETRTSPTGAYILAARRCFLFDGWSCIAEYDYVPNGSSATRTLYRSQVWGGSLAPGGAGGLLMVLRHTGAQTGTHFATHDGNGNVTALVDAATGAESARYEYDAFGNLLRAAGPFAAENPFRFSSQFADDVTGLLYYGYRHYDPVNGRWLSRDPIGEAGGVNLYGFLENDGVNSIDVLGLRGNPNAGWTQRLRSSLQASREARNQLYRELLAIERGQCHASEAEMRGKIERARLQQLKSIQLDMQAQRDAAGLLSAQWMYANAEEQWLIDQVPVAPILAGDVQMAIRVRPGYQAGNTLINEQFDRYMWQARASTYSLYASVGASLLATGPIGGGVAAWGQWAGQVLTVGFFGAAISESLYNEAIYFGYSPDEAQAIVTATHVVTIFAVTGGAIYCACRTGTIWDSIKPTQPLYEGTTIPRSFEMTTANGKIWVHGNATEHIAEYATAMLNRGVSPSVVNMSTQAQMRSLQAAVNAATANGVQYGKLLNIGGWELKFGAPQQAGQLPVLIHALAR